MLKRIWIHRLKVVSSTYHYKLLLSINYRVIKMLNDRLTKNKCYNAALKEAFKKLEIGAL